MTESLDHEATVAAIAANEPKLLVGQIWSIREGSKIHRAYRLLGPYPDKDKDGRTLWIQEEAPGVRTVLNRFGHRELSVIPEYNLRRLFKLDKEHTPPELLPRPRYPQIGDV